jgi:hypothetical protein
LSVIHQREKYLEQLQRKVLGVSDQLGVPPTEAVKLAQQIGITQVDIITLVSACVLGGFTSAIWTWRMFIVGGRKPTVFEICSSALASAMVAFVAACLQLHWGVPFIPGMAISVMCGFSGDSLIRVAILAYKVIVVGTVEKITGVKVNPEEDGKKK